MRSAGCVINDIADKNFDAYVTRTQSRPLASKTLSVKKAYGLFFVLCVMAFILVLFTNIKTIALAGVALCVAVIYPFLKRYTYFPQLVLGVAFSFGIPMAFAAEGKPLNFFKKFVPRKYSLFRSLNSIV